MLGWLKEERKERERGGRRDTRQQERLDTLIIPVRREGGEGVDAGRC